MQDTSEADSLDADVVKLRELLLGLGRRQPLRDPIASTIEEMGLTPPQIHGLLWLGAEGPLTMGELARRVGITEKTITGLVDRLERAGLVERERDTADRRVVRVRLTGQGEATYQRLQAQMMEKMRRILGRLDAADRRDLLRIFNNLLSAVESEPQGEHSS